MREALGEPGHCWINEGGGKKNHGEAGPTGSARLDHKRHQRRSHYLRGAEPQPERGEVVALPFVRSQCM